ncbi:uncharacterized [Tachysurus ichikawai]
MCEFGGLQVFHTCVNEANVMEKREEIRADGGTGGALSRVIAHPKSNFPSPAESALALPARLVWASGGWQAAN